MFVLQRRPWSLARSLKIPFIDCTNRIVADGEKYGFEYSSAYAGRGDAISISAPELPLHPGVLDPQGPLELAGCLRDGLPDAWGRRTLVRRLTGLVGDAAQAMELNELTVMLHSGSDRIGALDFQASAENFEPRRFSCASLETLREAADRLERNAPMSSSLMEALAHGNAVGGARPKALLDDGRRQHVAKFSSPGDVHDVVKLEYIAMRLAKDAAGLSVAPVQLQQVDGKDVLLVERFDRERVADGWTRRAIVSGLTLFGLSEMEARYASYGEFASIIQTRFAEPTTTLRELFGRLVFNVLVGNTDDHARNHAAFWDGARLLLTPAYDICPQARSGREANQAMLVNGEDRRSRLESCRLAAARFLLTDAEARALISHQVSNIRRLWSGICDEASLSQGQRAIFWGRQFLNDYIFEDYPDSLLH